MSSFETPTPALRVTLLGRTRIVCGSRDFALVLSARTQLAFAIIVTQSGEAISREELAFTLWPDACEAEARANLRRHLFVLQRTLPESPSPWLRCDGRGVAWAAADTWVDVNEFERLRASQTPLEALQLYRGEFLPFIDHEWATVNRARLRDVAVKLLVDAIAQTWSRGELIHCLEYLERLLGIDPWREDALRHLLVARCSLGDRAGAMAAYKRFRERLNLELGVDPMAETVRCFERLARGEIPQHDLQTFAYSS